MKVYSHGRWCEGKNQEVEAGLTFGESRFPSFNVFLPQNVF